MFKGFTLFMLFVLFISLNINSTNAQPDQCILTYINPDYNIKLEYPSNLTRIEQNLQPHEIVVFTFRNHNNSKLEDKPTINIESLFTKNLTFHEYLQYTNIHLKENFNDFRLISLKNITVNENFGSLITYYDYRNESNRKVVNFIVNGTDNYVYTVKLSSEPGRFEYYLPSFAKIITALEVIDNKTFLAIEKPIFEKVNEETNERCEDQDITNRSSISVAESSRLYNGCISKSNKDICDFLFYR